MKPEKVEYAAPGPGQCVLHRIDGALFMERADPVVAFPEHMVATVRAGKGAVGLALDGKTLLINASNRQVAYRLERCGQPGYLLGRLI